MGFDWIQDITIGAVINAADATEIRTNVDTVDDEKCAAEKVADQSTNYPAYCNDEHTGYLSNDHGTYQSGYDIGVDSTNYPGALNDEDTGYLSDDHGMYKSGYDIGVVGVCTPYCNDENTDYKSGDLVGVDSTYHTNYDGNQYPSLYMGYDGPVYSVN